MFIQVIQARAKNPAGVEAAVERWQKELKPGAKGWLGVTSGFTKDNDLITIVRFENEAAARANSDRPEQGAWFAEMSKNLEGAPTFFESSEVTPFGKGGSDDAGFVQVITGTSTNRKRMDEMDAEMEAAMEGQRPDVIGGIGAWNGDRFVQVIYFTSEREARDGEAKGVEGDAKALMEEMQSLMKDVRFFDLNDPRMESA